MGQILFLGSISLAAAAVWAGWIYETVSERKRRRSAIEFQISKKDICRIAEAVAQIRREQRRRGMDR